MVGMTVPGFRPDFALVRLRKTRPSKRREASLRFWRRTAEGVVLAMVVEAVVGRWRSGGASWRGRDRDRDLDRAGKVVAAGYRVGTGHLGRGEERSAPWPSNSLSTLHKRVACCTA